MHTGPQSCMRTWGLALLCLVQDVLHCIATTMPLHGSKPGVMQSPPNTVSSGAAPVLAMDGPWPGCSLMCLSPGRLVDFLSFCVLRLFRNW